MPAASKAIAVNPTLDAASIRQKLKLCRQRGKGFSLKRKMPESKLLDIECRLGHTFPEELRYFVLEIGNFGSGPFKPLPQMIDELRTPAGHLKKPFPHTGAWNLPQEYFDATPETDDDNEEATYAAYWEYRSEYFDDKHMAGAIPVSDEGCARYLWLIVNGPERGTLWHDDRTDDRGICPIRLIPDAPTRTFRWYTADAQSSSDNRVTVPMLYNMWLDRALKRLRIKWPQ